MELDLVKIQNASNITEADKQTLAAGLEYHKIPYFPISKEFLTTYVLNNVEYPVLEGKISQAATELKCRFNNIIDNNHECEKLKLDIEELEIEINELINGSQIATTHVQIKRKQLELQMKRYRLCSSEQSLKDMFREYNAWKTVLDECMMVLKANDPNVKTIDDIKFENVRLADMAVKTNRWIEMANNGEELTTPQKTLVFDKILREHKAPTLTAGKTNEKIQMEKS